MSRMPPGKIILGKYIAATPIAKLKATRLRAIKLLDIHNSSSATAPSPKIQKLQFFLYFCFSMLLVCLFVFSIYSNYFSINFCIPLKNPIRLTSAIVFIWSKLRCLWWFLCLQLKASKNLGPWRPLDFVYFIFCNRAHKSHRHTGSINHLTELFQRFCNHSLGIKSLSVSIFTSVSWLPS